MITILLRRINYNDILESWVNNKIQIKIQTRQKYKELIEKYLYPYFKEKTTNKITVDDFLNFIIEKNKEGVSNSVQKTLIYIIKSSWNYGMSIKKCKYIDFTKIKLKKYNPKITVFSKEEQLIIENYLKEKINIRRLCILLCLYTGLRIGEICGLKWKNIDFVKKVLYVERTITRVKNNSIDNNSKTHLIESTPKSNSSIREVPIPDFLIELLEKFKNNDEFYILSKSEKLYDPRQLEFSYKRVLKKCNIKIVKFHTLRHTFATRAIEAKIDIKTLSEILGHSSIEITLEIYVHSSIDLKRRSIDELVNFMTIA